MGNLLQWGSNWLEDQRTRHTTTAVTYRRGASQVEVLATIGKTEFEMENSTGILERTESRDYLILTADLVLDGLPTLPNRGDRVRETVGANIFIYEVMAPGGRPHYRYSDPYRKTLRIHTKHVATETS